MAGQFKSNSFGNLLGLLTITIGCALSMLSPPLAYGLTEPKKQPLAAGQTEPSQPEANELSENALPAPEPLIRKFDSVAGQPGNVTDTLENFEVIYDISKAPEPVIRMRELIVEAAASGDIERLRELMQNGTAPTQVTVSDPPEDPVAMLKSVSGDPEGREVLAILLDIMATGFVHTGVGTQEEAYIWPYFTEKQLDTLTPPQVVELLRIVTASDVSDMKEFGSYNFYRVGIAPDGKWKFFLAGD